MIKNKFEIGESVYSIFVGWMKNDVTCPDCLGKLEWEVSLPSKETFKHPCMTCRQGYYSTGIVSNYADNYKIEKRTIGSIRIDTADQSDPIQYMCLETGVGSGQVYGEKSLFKSYDEAVIGAEKELERIKGLKQLEELKRRKNKKEDNLIFGKREK
jgi:hypothetical protein